MKAGGLTLEWTLPKLRRKQAASPNPSVGRDGKLSRVTRLMALAVKFQGMVVRREVRDYADLARLGHVTRARITQIMNLLNLAPDIQEAILLLPPTTSGRDPISERGVRKLTAIVHWSRQRKVWRGSRS